MISYNPFSLENKTVLVTGASSGIGKATAIECSKIGATMIITGRNTERLNDTFVQLGGPGHIQITADLQKPEELTLLTNNIPEIDGIVNCAGVTKTLPFQYVSHEKLNGVMAVNFFAPVELTRILLKQKKLINNCSIVFISSISGVFCSAPAGSIYSASKGAINGIIKSMAIDLAIKGIRVNSVNPGVIETNIFDSGEITKEQLEEDKKRYPLKRHGRPEEVAYAVIYLLSNASSWVTGSNLVIDGGFTLQ
jgi:NAD(P)-dependent dehydrogenase (short-subunit alcohol dehydrogenase family)